MTDTRPLNCRFRLQEEGKAYPRSSCQACGKTITTGLGVACDRGQKADALKNDNNPPAFPWGASHRPEQNGRTLRDWFAGQALAGMLSDPGMTFNSDEACKVIAESCFNLADAMLVERSK